MTVELPTEIWIQILRRPELNGFRGISRMVCRQWRDILYKPRDRKTSKQFVDQTVEFLEFSIRTKYLEPPIIYSSHTSLSGFAARFGRVDLIEYLDEKEVTTEILANASYYNHTNALLWLAPEMNFQPLDCSNILSSTARGGHLSTIEWLVSFPNFTCDENICTAAAIGGHLELLEWLRDPDTGGGVCPWNERTCSYAADGGYLGLLKWLRDPDTGGGVCPWNGETTLMATRNGHNEILKWAVQQGCPVYPWHD